MTKYLKIGQTNETTLRGRLEVSSKYIEDWLPRSIWETLQRKGDKVVLTTAPHVVDAVLRYVPYTEVRKDVFIFANQPNGKTVIPNQSVKSERN
jgi:hypothetical protein